MALKKEISAVGIFSLATGAMISSGIFVLPSLAFSYAGGATFLAYLMAGTFALLGIQSIIELATAMPKAGGDYFFIIRSMGPLMGTISGVLSFFALSMKAAFAVYGIGEVGLALFGLPPLLTGGICILFFAVLNCFGAKEAAKLQNVLVAFLLLLLLLFIGSGWKKIDLGHFTPFFPDGGNGLVLTASLVFVSFGGLLKVVTVAEEVKDPKKDLPKAMIASIVVVTVLYVVSVIVITGVLPRQVFLASTTPVADAAGVIAGKTGYLLITAASLLAFFTTANAGILSASRYPLSLSLDGLFPSVFSRLSRRGTPVLSILLTSGLIFGSLLLPLEQVVKLASTSILISYTLTNLSVIILRESGVSNYRPSFRAPWYPFLQIFCIAVCIIFLAMLGRETLLLSLLCILACTLLYFLYGKHHYEGEYAMLLLLRKAANSHAGEKQLEQELREILVERDNIAQDSFDGLVKEALVFDIEEHLSFEELLSRTNVAMAERCDLPSMEILRLFERRQREQTTVLTPSLAVPHIITKEGSRMFLTLVRAKNGISFGPEAPDVKAVFLIGGPASKRSLHLQILKAIAECVREKDFPARWMEAGNEEELKNLFVLGNRRR